MGNLSKYGNKNELKTGIHIFLGADRNFREIHPRFSVNHVFRCNVFFEKMSIHDFRDAENQEMLLNFVINYCSPNHIEQTLEMIHQIRSDRENLDIGGSFIEFLSTPTNLLSTAVSSVSSTALRLSSVGSGSSLQDEDAPEDLQKKSSSPEPEENVSLEDLILQNREAEVETRLKSMFDIAIEGLEDTSKFSTAMLCLQATNNSSEWIDQSASKKDELVLLLLCYYLANKESSSPLPVLETIFNAANENAGQSESEFKTVHQRLLDFVYGEELIEYGIDPDEFLNDEQYRIDSIAGLADTDDDSQLTLGWFSRFSLAQRVTLTWVGFALI